MLNQAQHLNLDSVSTHRVSLALSAVLSLGNSAAPAHQSNAIPFPRGKGRNTGMGWVAPALPETLGTGGKVPPRSPCPPCACLAGTRLGSEQINHSLAFSLSQITKHSCRKAHISQNFPETDSIKPYPHQGVSLLIFFWPKALKPPWNVPEQEIIQGRLLH